MIPIGYGFHVKYDFEIVKTLSVALEVSLSIVYVLREATFVLVQSLSFSKTSSLVCREQGLGPHLLFTGHNELFIKLLMEESTQPPVLEM